MNIVDPDARPARLLRHRRRQHRRGDRAPRSSLRGTGRIAVAYFGDGATNQAYFFECLNFAKVLDLPVVFVCENNGYGEYTPMDVVTAGGIQPRVAAMEICRREPSTAWTCGRCTPRRLEVTDLVRGGSGPQFVEAITYRFVGHSRSDPGKYRPHGELERWRERDPLVVAAGRLSEQYGLDEGRLEAIRSEVDGRLEALEQEALAAPFPEPVARAEFAGQT